MKPQLALGLLAALTLSLGGVARSAEPKPEYWRDSRLEKRVNFPKPKGQRREPPLTQRDPAAPANDPTGIRQVRLAGGTVQEVTAVVKKLVQETTAPLIVRGDWAREAVALPGTELSAREWMDALADAFGARWWKHNETWVLAANPQEARLAALTQAERGADMKKNASTLLQSLVPGQWRKLKETGRLELGELTPQQRQVLRYDLQLHYFDANVPRAAALGAEALTGKGVYLGLGGKGKEAYLAVYAPAAPGAWSPQWQTTIPFYDPESGELLYGVAPPQ
jgi:hypothetical protein